MTPKEQWEYVKSTMQCEPLTVSPKISATMRMSMRGLLFILARYKFASKMLQNRKNLTILDLGCNDGLGDLMFQQDCDCKQIIGCDFDVDAIKWAKENLENDVLSFVEADFMGKAFTREGADCVVSLDVIEHIPKCDEETFADTVLMNLKDTGFAVIGTPNSSIFPYASLSSKVGHINNYTPERLYELWSRKFDNVFMFGMNDEVLNTGFYPMNCYILALCCNKRK